MSEEARAEAARFYDSLAKPVLVLSSRAGRGNISIAEAICEQFSDRSGVLHRSIEDFLPPAIVNEDLRRYRLISNHFPLLLAGMYTIPFLYARKLVRERLRRTRLEAMERFLQSEGIRTIVGVSHRQAFWAGVLKRNTSAAVAIHGVLTEFGPSLGWKYIFWDQMDGFVSPLPREALAGTVPVGLPFRRLALPARAAFGSLPRVGAAEGDCLLMGGLWGQGRMKRALDLLVRHFPESFIHVVCGDNQALQQRVRERYGGARNISIHGLLDSIQPLLAKCSCVVTKPGMGTLLEAQASGRKIFLFPGIPIAETHNARHAIAHLDAEWLTVEAFARWRGRAAARG